MVCVATDASSAAMADAETIGSSIARSTLTTFMTSSSCLDFTTHEQYIPVHRRTSAWRPRPRLMSIDDAPALRQLFPDIGDDEPAGADLPVGPGPARRE